METDFKCVYSGKIELKEKIQCNCSKSLTNVAENIAHSKISFKKVSFMSIYLNRPTIRQVTDGIFLTQSNYLKAVGYSIISCSSKWPQSK